MRYPAAAEDQLFVRHVWDLLARCRNRNIPQYSAFLTPHQRSLVLESFPEGGYAFFGGYEEAERVVFAALPDYLAPEETSHFPVACAQISYPGQYRLSHRDFLGAILALGLERETLGDILVEEGRAVVFLQPHVLPILLQELVKVGSVGVHAEAGAPEEIAVKRQEVSLSGTVSSPRLDSVLALFLRISREKVKELIAGGSVMVNHREERRADCLLKEQDILSVRGFGRGRVESVGGQSRKGRIFIEIKKSI